MGCCRDVAWLLHGCCMVVAWKNSTPVRRVSSEPSYAVVPLASNGSDSGAHDYERKILREEHHNAMLRAGWPKPKWPVEIESVLPATVIHWNS